MTKLAEIVAKRATAFDAFKALAEKNDYTVDKDQAELDRLHKEVTDLDAQIDGVKKAQALAATTAQPVAGQEETKVPAAPETDLYVKEKSLILGGIIKMIGVGGDSIYNARQAAKDIYGESHPVTKALLASNGAAGGFLVPPDTMNEIIPLLRAEAVVRGADPISMPMPRGTMTLPGQSGAASASYGGETKAIAASQQKFSQKVASYKKLTALVPISNDMMRYASPAIDAVVRDDLVTVLALREDLAFLLGDGMQDSPRGWLSFANGLVGANGGTVGAWSTSANSVFAVNGADPANSTGGNFITSNATFTLATAAQELGGAVNRLDTANVKSRKRCWFMHPRVYNYLFNVQNSLGVYVFRDELMTGKLLTYPFKLTTQIGANYWDTTGTNKDLSFIFLAEMTESIILDSMQLELAVSREGTYVDALGATISAFQNDQTLIRAIAEHDFQMRHDHSVALIQGVRWAPAIQ